jgi:hypothetical protein
VVFVSDRCLVDAVGEAVAKTGSARDEMTWPKWRLIGVLTETFGERDKGWETKKQPKRDGTGTTPWVYVKQP